MNLGNNKKSCIMYTTQKRKIWRKFYQLNKVEEVTNKIFINFPAAFQLIDILQKSFHLRIQK